ncbi:MAG: histidine kinase [Bacteroidota bacterium]
MKPKTSQVLVWHLIFCVFYYWLREILLRRDWETISQLLRPEEIGLSLISFGILFGYAIGPYLVLTRLHRRPWPVVGSGLLLASMVAVAFRYLLEEVIAPVTIGFRNYSGDISYLDYYLDNLYYWVLHGAIGVIVFLLQRTRQVEQDRQSLLIENQKTELAFLRSQINPHFLFNSLNNIYSLFFIKSDQALQAIERLTTMLRYGLYEQAEKVPLHQEIDHLLNFIELEKMRYDFEPEIELSLPDEDRRSILVPPLLLITFIENAFKHGDLRRSVTISLEVSQQLLHYQVANEVQEKQKDAIGGIGLVNLKKRLSLMYGDKQEVEISIDGGRHIAQLQIALS